MPNKRKANRPKANTAKATPPNGRSRRRIGKKRRVRLPMERLLSKLPNGNGFIRLMESNFTFAIFIAIIGLLYIWNAHYAEKLAREEGELKTEIKELRSEYMTLNARLSVARQQTSLEEVVDSLGLEPLKQPPFKIYRDE